MDRLLDVMAIFSLVLMALVLIPLRRAHIRVEYSVSWLTAAVTLLILSRSSVLLDWLSHQMGISYPPVALLLIASSVFLVVFYRFSIRISDLKDANIALARDLPYWSIVCIQLMKTSKNRAPVETPAAPPAWAPKWWHYAIGFVAFLFIAFEIYGPALSGPFVFDDVYLPVLQSESGQSAAPGSGQMSGRC